ncbi:DUF4345 domain-containing protein [Roseivirga sp.]|uniref:DUF4345 domain-containing protein n=1 Tax=Roseivirga sp. TaxID=1964215 RepID=UPI003B8AFD4C
MKKSRKTFLIKNLHLFISLAIVTPFAFVYGLNPESILPIYFDFEVNSIDLNHFFRAIMGLYLGISAIWIIGIANPRFWKTATLLNVVFMLGLALGRTISFFSDGTPSQPLITALFLELILGMFGWYQMKKYTKQE